MVCSRWRLAIFSVAVLSIFFSSFQYLLVLSVSSGFSGVILRDLLQQPIGKQDGKNHRADQW
jgi:hypothetical protein